MPTEDEMKSVTHLLLFAIDMTTFSSYLTSTGGTFPAVKAIKAKYPEVKVMAAAGGWALDGPFRPAAKTAASQKAFAANIATFIQQQELDGLDMDWEYPVGNGQFYKLPADDPQATGRPIDESEKETYPQLLAAIKAAMPQGSILSIAVPSRKVDMLAYTADTGKKIDASVDFWNLMTYDHVNRRDTTGGPAAGGTVIKEAIAAYKAIGVSPDKMNIGFPMYSRYFPLANDCTKPEDCQFKPMEDDNGKDLGNSGVMTFNPIFNTAVNAPAPDSWQLAQAGKKHDSNANADYFIDLTNHLYWSWLEASTIQESCEMHITEVGGAMFYSLGQDESGNPHLAAIFKCVSSVTA